MKRLCLPAAVRHIQQSRHDTVARPAVILHSTLQILPPQLRNSQKVNAMPRPQRDLGDSLPLHPCLLACPIASMKLASTFNFNQPCSGGDHTGAGLGDRKISLAALSFIFF